MKLLKEILQEEKLKIKYPIFLDEEQIQVLVINTIISKEIMNENKDVEEFLCSRYDYLNLLSILQQLPKEVFDKFDTEDELY